MRARLLRCLHAVVLLGATGLADARPPGVVTSLVQLPEDRRLETVFSADADGDGLGDLIVVALRLDAKPHRSLRIHLRRETAPLFESEPDRTIELPSNVTACAVGDVHPRPGPELVLFSPRDVVAVWIDAVADGRRGERLLAADILWQLPHPWEVVIWQEGLVDLDGDGLLDLIIPRPDGYRVALRQRDGASPIFRQLDLAVPAEPTPALIGEDGRRAIGDPTDGRLELDISVGDDERTEPLLRVDERVPSPHAADWDADGDLDLVAQTKTQLLVWIQDPPGRYPTTATHRLDLPVKIDWPELDLSYRSHLADLNGDRRVDYVLIANDRFSKETRAQVLPYLQHGDGSTSIFDRGGRPPRAVLPSGFVPVSRLHDVDGDGLPELILVSFRPEDMGSQLDGGGDVAVRGEYFVYRNDGAGFASTPFVRYPLRLSVEGGDTAARFLVDVTGDSVRDLVVRDEPQRVRLLPVVRDRSGAMRVGDRPLWTMAVDPSAEVRFIDADSGRGEILVVDESQFIHVRLR